MIDLHVSLGNLLTIGAIGGAFWLQTRKLGHWQGTVDQVLKMLVKDYDQRHGE